MSGQKMLKFVDVERDMPEKRPPDLRRTDFHEIYAEYADEKAKEQAARCSQCGVPYCQSHCPLHNNIPDWLRLTAENRLQEAYELSQATNTFPEICGRICPQDRLCEGNCVIEKSGHGTVTIGQVEKYITDTAWEEGWVKPIVPYAERTESVGIIGAGPAGLAAADKLRREGIQVTVYDRYDRAGGLMTYGIPGFKLEKDVVMRRNDQLEQGGVEFVLNCDVGGDLSFDAIRAKHDAVLIATGVYKSRELQAPGSGADGIVRAIDYLTASNRKSFGDTVPEFESGELNAEGKKVVVIGGGDTAMDCVRTATRQGAESVKCLYRRDRDNMPGSQREVNNAEEEGVEFVWLTAPKGFSGDAVEGVMVQQMRLGRPRRHGPPEARTDRGQRLHRRGRPRHQGAGLRARRAAQALGGRGPGGHALGHRQGRVHHRPHQPRRRLCRRGHRARRESCRLGHSRRTRRGGCDPGPRVARRRGRRGIGCVPGCPAASPAAKPPCRRAG